MKKGGNLSLKKEIFISRTPKEVFELLINANEIIKYYPLNSMESNWGIGNEIILKGGEGDDEFTDYGIIESLVKDEKFQYRYWSTNHGTKRIRENHLTICYILNPHENGTKLTLEQSNFNSTAMYHRMLPVWDFLLSSLKNYAESKNEVG
ncbi:MAG: SRPBCC domain-containing protein [Bacteroidetes bacterium]|jgi:uncharacterized protein YndB with AHSA1/START domain|nr:SRPBCC domain-containing protein [Bacteroidota bacterium]MDF1868639.1 SRPBCC domain-containing protein [Saprospiraceae bacterium]